MPCDLLNSTIHLDCNVIIQDELQKLYLALQTVWQNDNKTINMQHLRAYHFENSQSHWGK